MSTIFIAEKPSIAESIARNLGGNYSRAQSKATPIYQFDFQGPCIATSVAGHLFQINFAAEYQSWATEEEKLFQKDHIIQELSTGAGNILGQLRQLCKSCKKIILALDADREGENICFEIMRNIDFNRQNIYRLRFSSLTQEEITRQMKVLVRPDELLSNAVEVRQELDLKIGIAFSRFQTKFLSDKYADLNTKTISYGPCQIPTLNFCVERHEQILNFKPQKYFEIDCSLQLENSIDIMKLLLSGFSTFNNEEALLKAKYLKNIQLVVSDQKQSHSKVARPGGMNTVKLLKLASEILRISPNDALHRAETLYLQGYLTYPRTESTSYPAHFQFNEVINACSQLKQLEDACLMIKLPNPKKGVDAGDHPPITPTSKSPTDLGGIDLVFYLLIARNFLASIMKDAEVSNVDSYITGDEVQFKVRNKEYTDIGWKILYDNIQQQIEEDVQAEDEDGIKLCQNSLKKGQKFSIIDTQILDKVTRPPGYLTESQLLTIMEKNQIGTDASMATHIQNIIDRNYVSLNTSGRGRCLVPTQLGIGLISGYRLIDRELVSSQLRANMEADMNKVAEGKIQKSDMLATQLAKYLDKFKYFKANINLMDQLFESKFISVKEAGKPFMQCGICSKYMRLINRIPQRLYCPTCDRMFQIVQNGKIIEIDQHKCHYCGFGLLSSMIAVKEKRTVFCPNCFTEGGDKLDRDLQDFEDKKVKHRNISCSQCMNAQCSVSLPSNYIGECPNCYGMGFDSKVIGLDEPEKPAEQKAKGANVVISATDDIVITLEPEPIKFTIEDEQKSNDHTIEHKLFLDNFTVPGQAVVCCNSCQLVLALPQGKVFIQKDEYCDQCDCRKIKISNKAGEVSGCVCSMEGVEIINSGRMHDDVRSKMRARAATKGKVGKGFKKGGRKPSEKSFK